jgi:hypothetical protein
MRRRISHQAIGSLIRTSSQPVTRTTSCTLATLSVCLVCPKRSEVMPPPCPVQGMHTMYPIPDAYDLSSFSLAVCCAVTAINQSICRAHIQPSHVLIFRTVSIRIKVTCLCVPLPAQFRSVTPSVCLPSAVVLSSNQPNAAGRYSPSPLPSARDPPLHPPPFLPFLPFLPPLAVARPHAHHVGNAEATRYCTLLCAAESRRRRQTVRRGGVGARSCRCVAARVVVHSTCEHCSRVPAGCCLGFGTHR